MSLSVCLTARRALIMSVLASFVPPVDRIPPRPMDRNLGETVADWRARLTHDQVAHFVVIGDSVAFRKDGWPWYLRPMLEQTFGVAGDGYLAFNGSFSHLNDGSRNRRPGLSFERSRSWSQSSVSAAERDEFGRRSVDGIYTRIGATGWVQVGFYGPEATLHYVSEPGAGVIRIEVNGAWVADVDASRVAVAPRLATFTFETGQSDPNVLNRARFSLVGAAPEDPQWTQLNGLFMRTGAPGPLYSRLSRGGVGPEDFMSCSPAIFRATLESLNPDLVVIMLDHDHGEPYIEHLRGVVRRVETAVPEAEILLATHHRFEESRGPDADDALAIALQRNHGFLNLFDLHRDFDHLNRLGFLHDSVHLSARGGAWFAGQFLEALEGWTQPIGLFVDVGDWLEGDVYELRASDDDRALFQSGIGQTAADRNQLMTRVSFVTDVASPATIDLRVESRMARAAGAARVRLWNWTASRFDTVGEDWVEHEESELRIEGIPAPDYVGPGGRIKLAIKHTVVVPIFAFRFDTLFDHVRARVR